MIATGIYLILTTCSGAIDANARVAEGASGANSCNLFVGAQSIRMEIILADRFC